MDLSKWVGVISRRVMWDGLMSRRVMWDGVMSRRVMWDGVMGCSNAVAQFTRPRHHLTRLMATNFHNRVTQSSPANGLRKPYGSLTCASQIRART